MLKLSSCIAAVFLMASPALADVRGLYGSECLAVEGLSAKKDLLFKAETMETVQTVYGDSQCATPAYDFSFVGTYVLNQAASHLDYAYETIKLRVLDARIAEAFNEVGLCGFSDWLVNVDKEVAGRDCGGQLIPAAGTTVFDQIKETETGIQLGLTSELNDGLSLESRPTDLDPNLYSAK